MKTNSQSATAKKIRLTEAIKLASSHEGFQAGIIESNEDRVWGAMSIFDVRLVLDIIEDDDGDVLRVHVPKWLPMPSIEVADVIANQTNHQLMVAKVLVIENHLGVFAHEFVGKDHLPAETNLARLINDVLKGVVLILKQHNLMKQELAAMERMPINSDPCLN